MGQVQIVYIQIDYSQQQLLSLLSQFPFVVPDQQQNGWCFNNSILNNDFIQYYLGTIIFYYKRMFENCNKTIDVELQAKRTLAFFSDYDENFNQWEFDAKLINDKKRQLRLLNPIKNDKSKGIGSQTFYKGRTPLVPSKVCLQNQTPKSRKNLRTSCPRNSYFTITKQNYKPQKTIRNVHSVWKQTEQKQQDHSIDFMQYWVRHRFEDGAISSLVQKLRDNKNNTILRL